MMGKKRLSAAALAMVTIPILMFGGATPASAADADVTWTSADGNGDCLRHDDDNTRRVFTYPASMPTWQKCRGGWSDSVQWHDDNSNLDTPDGAWAEKTPGNNGQCMAAWQDQVYLEPCSSPVNWYQQWYEIKVDQYHWKLQNRMSGRFLTADVNGYVSAQQGGAGQLWS
ncbi:hypothetical protein [Kitasatospora cinereorecta]|uniref:Ricin B lectin domain-containing protein n=1 Tax=Kitasatospora cinereorecta TaxID=285560 RepID=A0ABW0VCM7_9ACTN